MSTPDIPTEADEADVAEQDTPVDEAAPFAEPPSHEEADEGDLAESAREVPLPEDERR